jgi:hypothetical protein
VKQREDIRRLKLSKEQLELFRSRFISLFKPNDLVKLILNREIEEIEECYLVILKKSVVSIISPILCVFTLTDGKMATAKETSKTSYSRASY